MPIEKKVVGVVGMPGSGKSVVSNIARDLGFFVIVMGDVLREETFQRGLEPTPENIGRVMLQIRKEEGAEVIAKRCILKGAEAEIPFLIIEGIRSLNEVKEFRKKFPNLILLSIHSSPETRYKRLFKRGRSDDSSNQKIFMDRDERELKIGIGSVIALADYVIVNEGLLWRFRAKVKSFLKAIIDG